MISFTMSQLLDTLYFQFVDTRNVEMNTLTYIFIVREQTPVYVNPLSSMAVIISSCPFLLFSIKY